MMTRAEFLNRIASLTADELFDAFYAETVEHGGTFEPTGAIKTIDLHDVRIDHDDTEGAMIRWIHRARQKETEESTAWAETVFRDPQAHGCERRKAAKVILDHSLDMKLRLLAMAELERLDGRAA